MHAEITACFVNTRTYHDWVRLNVNLLQNPANPQFNLNTSSRYAAAAAGASPLCRNGGVTTDTTFTAASFDVCAQAFTNVNQFFTPNEFYARLTQPALGHNGAGRTVVFRRPPRPMRSHVATLLLLSSLLAFAQRAIARPGQIMVNEVTNTQVTVSPDHPTILADIQGLIFSLPINGGAAR